MDDFNVYAQELIKRTVWTGDCRSWFKRGNSDGRVTAMYPGSVIHCKELLDEFRTEDFVHFLAVVRKYSTIHVIIIISGDFKL